MSNWHPEDLPDGDPRLFGPKEKKKKGLGENFFLLFSSRCFEQDFTFKMKKAIGEYLRELRKTNGFTLTQMGAKLGMDSGALSKVETGKKLLDSGYLPRIAEIFNLDLENLKAEFFAEKIAYELIENACNESTLKLAEEKVKYIKIKSAKQAKLNL